ncbi:MAG: hypothetical protein EAZ89_02365, partial [Bacteroidetes bacterium]
MVFFADSQRLFAQLPPNQPEQDCFGAIPICQNTYFQANSYVGAGDDPYEIEGANSCMLIGERNSVWYTFTVQTSGLLCFTINPVDSLDDYDWALYDLTNASCADIPNNPALEVRCNWTFNSGCAGRTGANNASECPIQNESCLPVNAGETFVLNVSNFTGSSAGYLLDLSASSATLYDGIPPGIRTVKSICGGVQVRFTENVLCSSVDSTDFVLTGPGGTYTVQNLSSQNCDAGGIFESTFDLIVTPELTQPGLYTLSLTGIITDYCGNPAPFTSQQVNIPQPPVAGINAQFPQCQESNVFGFAYSGPSLISGFSWDFGDGSGSSLSNPIYSYQDFGIHTVTLGIIDNNGCRDTATLDVTVLPAPLADFEFDLPVCQNDSLNIRNLSLARGGSDIMEYSWRFSGGRITSEPEPSHVFTSAGLQYIILTANNTLNCPDTLLKQITVYPAPESRFLPEDNVCYQDTVNLLNQSTIRSDIAADYIADWYWSWGDSSQTGAVAAPTHVYDTAGIFYVTLTTISDKGCRDSLTLPQQIYRPRAPEVNDDPVCFGKPAFLQAIPEEGGITYWYRGLTDTAAFLKASVHYTPPVIFFDTFYTQVLSQQGCWSERAPVVMQHHYIGMGNIVAQDSVAEFPSPIVNFSLAGNILGDRYEWNFSDGTTDNSDAPAHQFAYPGLYDVRLRVWDIYGCQYEINRDVEVKNVVVVHVPSAFTPNGDGFNDRFFVVARLIQQMSFGIYNRYGQEMFRSDSPDFIWNGTGPDGRPAPEGVYVYRLYARDLLGHKVER